jgi:hypothetical protein
MNKADRNGLEADIERTIRAAVRRYKMKCWWTDEDDLYGWGVQVALEALRTWDPARGERLTYVRSALIRGLWRRVLRESAPVSATDHELRELAGKTRAPLQALTFHVDPTPWAEQVIDDEGWKRRVAHLLGDVADKVPDGHMGLSVLRHGATVQEVAKSYRVPTRRVRAAVVQLQTALAARPDARLILRERC